MEFAAATTDNAHWKKLNHQLLLCSKHDDTKVGLPWLLITLVYRTEYNNIYWSHTVPLIGQLPQTLLPTALIRLATMWILTLIVRLPPY